MPRWDADPITIEKQIWPGTLLSIAALLFVILAIKQYLTSQVVLLLIINLLISFSLLIYSLGRLYGEITKDRDFIEITADGITYRSTPAFGFGWIPRVNMIKFSEISKVDMIQISSYLQPEKKSNALLLQLKTGKDLIIGTHLNEEQLMGVLLSLKGSVVFSNAIKRLFGDEVNVDDTIKNLVKNAKDLWNRYKKQ